MAAQVRMIAARMIVLRIGGLRYVMVVHRGRVHMRGVLLPTSVSMGFVGATGKGHDDRAHRLHGQGAEQEQEQ